MNDSEQVIKNLKKQMARFINERDWQRYHNPKNISMSIAIEAAELMELFQWITAEESLELYRDNPEKRARVKEELADIILYCLSLANVMDIDISQAVADKIKLNEKKYPVEKVKGKNWLPEGN